MKVAPTADVSDGLFDVTIWSGYGLSDFVFKSAGMTPEALCEALWERLGREVLPRYRACLEKSSGFSGFSKGMSTPTTFAARPSNAGR